MNLKSQQNRIELVTRPGIYTKQVLPNVKVEDMGHKMGLNGVDNAKITFDNVRVPRDNLLNRYSDVDDEGNFVSEIGSGRARFLAVADQLLSGSTIIKMTFRPFLDVFP